MALFDFRTYKNQYYLKNNTSNSATYTIELSDDCCDCNNSNQALTQTYTILPNQEKVITLTKDGIYTLTVTSTGNPNFVFTITNFNTLEKRLIEDIKAFLCGDDCVECNDCKGDCIEDELHNLVMYQNIFNELMTFNYFTTYSETNSSCQNCVNSLFLQKAVRLYKCDILSELCVQLTSSDFFGKAKGGLELFRKYVAIFYLSLYFKKYYAAIDNSERKFVDDLYQICKIRSCIKKLGISIDELEALYLEVLNTDCTTIPPEDMTETILRNTLNSLELILAWKNGDTQKSPKEIDDLNTIEDTQGITDSIYTRDGIITNEMPDRLPSGRLKLPDSAIDFKRHTRPLINNLIVKIPEWASIKDYSPRLIISKYSWSKYKGKQDKPVGFENSPHWATAGYKFNKNLTDIRKNVISLQKGYQVLDIGQEYYFAVMKNFDGSPNSISRLHVRGANKRYQGMSKTDYTKLYNTGFFAWVPLEFRIGITFEGKEIISKPLGRLKMQWKITANTADNFITKNTINFKYV